MRNKTVKKRGAEVRVSRAKSRVVAKRKAAFDAHRLKRVKDTPARHGSEGVDNKKASVRHAADAGLAPEKKRSAPSREVHKIKKKEKIRRTSTGYESDLDLPATGTPGRKKKKRTEKRLAHTRGAPATGVETDGTTRRMDETAGAKGKRRVSRPARILLLGALLVISLAAMLWVYTFTGVLNVTEVEVRGNEVLGEGYLRSLSGITSDTHLLKMDVKAVEGALLSEPYIARVDVSRHFPNKVVLEITERKPTGFIVQNGKYNLVDQEGMVLESVDAVPPGLVEIKVLDMQLLLPGEEIGGVDYATVTSLLGSLPSALREVTTAVGVRDGEGLYLEGKGTLVIYGEATELSRKNTIALLALTGLVDRYGAVEYIDISFPDHPVIKPAGAG